MTQTVLVELPSSLRVLARIGEQVRVSFEGPATRTAILDALEALHPVLLGTIRDRTTKVRRPFVRFFACQQDLSHTDPDEPLPDTVAAGIEPFLIVGAIAGG